MSRDSDLIDRTYAAWNHDDLAAWLETLHPEFEFHTSGVWPDFDPVYRGHEGAAEFWRAMHEPWEEFRIDVERVEQHGDWFLLTVRFRARGVDSGVEVDMRFANAVRVHDGLVIEIVSRRNVDETLELVHERQVRGAKPETIGRVEA